MARPAKYSSDVERRRADAERKRKAREAMVDPELPVVDVDEPPAPGRQVRRVSFSEEEYVRSSLDRPYLINREGAERYARWRYRMFLRGEVASL